MPYDTEFRSARRRPLMGAVILGAGAMLTRAPLGRRTDITEERGHAIPSATHLADLATAKGCSHVALLAPARVAGAP